MKISKGGPIKLNWLRWEGVSYARKIPWSLHYTQASEPSQKQIKLKDLHPDHQLRS